MNVQEVANRYSFWFEDENGNKQDGGLIYQMDAFSKKEVKERVKEIYGGTEGLVIEKWTH